MDLNNSSHYSSVTRKDSPWIRNISKKSETPEILAVGGGKGGVGKSLVLSNFAISLALKGFKVIALDLDLGGANLHTCLNINIPEFTLSDLMLKKVSNINELLIESSIPNLSLICGAQDEMGMANLRNQFKSRIFSSLKTLDADYILFDLGAGTSNNTLDFFNAATKGILVSLPEPTSIENTYRFIKSALYREINSIEGIYQVQKHIDEAFNSKMSKNSKTPNQIFQDILAFNPKIGEKIQHVLSKFSPELIINQARTREDILTGHSIALIARKHFGIKMKFMGHLSYDSSVWQCVKKRKPLLMEFSHSTVAKDFDGLIKNLLQ